MEPGPLLPLPVSLALAVGNAVSIIWIVSVVGRRSSVRGSRPRYVWASIEHATRWVTLFTFVVSVVVEGFWYRDWFMFCVSCSGIALWLVLRRDNDDDDDFFSRLREKGWSQAWAATGA